VQQQTEGFHQLIPSIRYSYCVIAALSPHPEELAPASVSKDEARIHLGASWFETALMRPPHHAELLTQSDDAFQRHCEERSDEAIQELFGSSLDCFARNDGW
jgi:hypothetical protein